MGELMLVRQDDWRRVGTQLQRHTVRRQGGPSSLPNSAPSLSGGGKWASGLSSSSFDGDSSTNITSGGTSLPESRIPYPPDVQLTFDSCGAGTIVNLCHDVNGRCHSSNPE